jgi:hypothetical protein
MQLLDQLIAESEIHEPLPQDAPQRCNRCGGTSFDYDLFYMFGRCTYCGHW